MAGWLKRWILNIITIILVAAIVKGFEVNYLGAIFGSAALGIINAIIRPIAIALTLPINIMTLGLFTLVINGLMLWFVSVLIKGFDIYSFGAAILAALLISVFSFVFNLFIKD